MTAQDTYCGRIRQKRSSGLKSEGCNQGAETLVTSNGEPLKSAEQGSNTISAVILGSLSRNNEQELVKRDWSWERFFYTTEAEPLATQKVPQKIPQGLVRKQQWLTFCSCMPVNYQQKWLVFRNGEMRKYNRHSVSLELIIHGEKSRTRTHSKSFRL